MHFSRGVILPLRVILPESGLTHLSIGRQQGRFSFVLSTFHGGGAIEVCSRAQSVSKVLHGCLYRKYCRCVILAMLASVCRSATAFEDNSAKVWLAALWARSGAPHPRSIPPSNRGGARELVTCVQFVSTGVASRGQQVAANMRHLL